MSRFFAGTKNASLEEKFNFYVVKKSDGCWEWDGPLNNYGYGRFRYKGHEISAHRASYIIHIGPLEPEECVLHHCDNPPCSRPDHLFKGSKADNVADAVKKNRMARQKGILHGQAKLTEQDIREIRKLRKRGAPYYLIGEHYGVCAQQIHRIVTRQRWGHIS